MRHMIILVAKNLDEICETIKKKKKRKKGAFVISPLVVSRSMYGLRLVAVADARVWSKVARHHFAI